MASPCVQEAPSERTQRIGAGTLTDAHFMNFELNWPLMNLECATSVPKQ